MTAVIAQFVVISPGIYKENSAEIFQPYVWLKRERNPSCLFHSISISSFVSKVSLHILQVVGIVFPSNSDVFPRNRVLVFKALPLRFLTEWKGQKAAVTAGVCIWQLSLKTCGSKGNGHVHRTLIPYGASHLVQEWQYSNFRDSAQDRVF